MPAFYDTLGSLSQLGGDLQFFSSNGWFPPAFTPPATSSTHWDAVTHSSFSGPLEEGSAAPNMTDMVVYQGELHVVWVEPQWNGSTRMMRGPFVKKWNGSAWVSLGGEVDPAITPTPWTQDPIPPGGFGARGAPARPHIITDGVDLWVAYTVREVVDGATPPPNGSWVPGQACGCYVGPCDHTNYTIWHPRKTYVRKWNSGTGLWDLYGDLPALTNNALKIGTAAIAESFVNLHAWASPGETDTVYVTMYESGVQAAIVNYSTGPTCLFGIQFGTPTQPPQYKGVRTARFTTATGVSGTVKDLFVHSLPAGSPLNLNNTLSVSKDVYIVNNSGTPFVFYNDLSVTPNVLHMKNWNTLVDAQTLPGGTYSQVVPPYGPAHDDSNSTYYLTSINVGGPVVETLDDGTGAIQPLDFATYGTAYWHPPTAGFFADKLAPEMGSNGNLWGVYAEDLEQFHHNCPAWVDWGFAGASSVTQQHVGEAYPVLLGDALYAVCGFRDPTNTAVDYKVQVYGAPICRGCGVCGGGGGATAAPFLTSKHQIGHGVSGATGSSGPFVNTEFRRV